jgi:hypothetical protein
MMSHVSNAVPDTVSAHHNTKEGSESVAQMMAKMVNISRADSDILVKVLMSAGNPANSGEFYSPSLPTFRCRELDPKKVEEVITNTPPKGRIESTVEQVCTQCHSIQIVISHWDTRAGWVRVIGDIASQGAATSDEDADLIMQIPCS